MSDAFHKHVIDGKEVFYKEDDCPVCGTRKPAQQEQRQANVYRKGDTIVCMSGKALMMTIHPVKDRNVLLINMKKMARDTAGQRIMDKDNKPMWNQTTLGLPMSNARTLHTLLGELLEGKPEQPQAPDRA